jgi:biopolymer transport protein TolQ
MISLLLASVWVWAIVFEKMTSLRRVNRAANAFEDRFWSGGSLEELFAQEGEEPSHPLAAVFGSAMREWRRSSGRALTSDLAVTGLKERVERAMVVSIQREMDRLERWMVFLATVGSAGPFIGLFGTVWGIMNSFSAIAGMQNTNLAVVAPGIAEALFATAIGLIAAIPATWRASPGGWKPSPLSSRPSCPASRKRRPSPGARRARRSRRGTEPWPAGGSAAGNRSAAGAPAIGRWPRSTSRRWSTSCSCC